MILRRLVLLTAVIAASLEAQQKQPAFDVISIKPTANDESATGVISGFQPMPDGMRAVSITVEALITIAYGILKEQISGSAPKWIGSEGFDINAKFDPAAPGEPQKLMDLRLRLQAMLRDRFQLSTHRETRETKGFALRAGKKKGPKLNPAKTPDEGFSSSYGKAFMELNGATMDEVAQKLAEHFGRPVVNQTGLEGRFDFRLEYQPEEAIGRATDNGTDFHAPSFSHALDEQLGLKLESKKVPVEMLVIDRVEHPSAN